MRRPCPDAAVIALIVMALTVVSGCASAPRSDAVHGITPVPPAVTGEVRLEPGDAAVPPGRLRSPWGISFGMDGTLYVCDRDRSGIMRFAPDGARMAVFDSYTNRTERLYQPVDVSSTSGIDIYAIDTATSRVLRFDRNLRNGFTIFRGRDSGDRRFGSFGGLAYDDMTGDLFVTDRDTGVVIRIDMLGDTVRTMGGFGSGQRSLDRPAGLDVDGDGTLYIADTGAGDIAVVRGFSGAVSHVGGDALVAPVDVAVIDDAYLAVADRDGVVVMTRDGAAAGYAGFGAGMVMKPRSVAFRDGALYVSDGSTAAVLTFTVKAGAASGR